MEIERGMKIEEGSMIEDVDGEGERSGDGRTNKVSRRMMVKVVVGQKIEGVGRLTDKIDGRYKE